MEKTVENIRYDDIQALAEEGKSGTKIIWLRDGSHSTDDLQTVLEFGKLGFRYKICNYIGKFEKNAIKIEFTYERKQYGQDPAIFTLKEEHIKLIENLNFKVCAETEYNDRYIPGIDRKRPFGNSGATGDVLEILGRECDEEGEFRKEDIDEAETLLIELPLALTVIVENKTFTPGDYEVERYGTYSQYQRMKNYKALNAALDEVEEALCRTEEDWERFTQLQEICMNVSGDNPWDVMRDIRWGEDLHAFWDGVIHIFEKHHAQARGKDKCCSCRHNSEPFGLDCEYACNGVTKIAQEGKIVLACDDYERQTREQ